MPLNCIELRLLLPPTAVTCIRKRKSADPNHETVHRAMVNPFNFQIQ